MNELSKNKKYDLANRLIQFAVLIIKITDSLFETKAGNHLGGQLVRSGTHPAHYGEAQSAESRQDFIHKFKVLLKEPRETKNSLMVIKLAPPTTKADLVELALNEIEELISISFTCISTAEQNPLVEKKIGKGQNRKAEKED